MDLNLPDTDRKDEINFYQTHKKPTIIVCILLIMVFFYGIGFFASRPGVLGSKTISLPPGQLKLNGLDPASQRQSTVMGVSEAPQQYGPKEPPSISPTDKPTPTPTSTPTQPPSPTPTVPMPTFTPTPTATTSASPSAILTPTTSPSPT